MGAHQQQAVLRTLVRRIFRVHRTLPEPMKEIGNAYFKDELLKHTEGRTTMDQWKVFVREWERYCEVLTSQKQPAHERSNRLIQLGVDAGGSLSRDVIDQLSNEQKVKLLELEREALKAGQELWQSSEHQSSIFSEEGDEASVTTGAGKDNHK